MRILITGISGFAGRHLAELLARNGHQIAGTVHQRASIERLLRQQGARTGIDAGALHQVDIANGAAVAAVVGHVKPDAVFHLAGTALVGGSDADPASVFSINALGTLYVLAAVREHCATARVVVIGSGSAYGLLEPTAIPVTEECPFRPMSAYGVSKAAADLIAYQWARGHGLDVIRVRPFNHIGPGQEPGFICPDVARQLVDEGVRAIQVGNVDVVRDFTDVRDVVAAYVAVLEHGTTGEVYNVCSGVGRTVREVVERMIAMSGVSAALERDSERLRPADVPVAIGSARKLHDATGWTPQIPLAQSLADILADWRDRTRA